MILFRHAYGGIVLWAAEEPAFCSVDVTVEIDAYAVLFVAVVAVIDAYAVLFDAVVDAMFAYPVATDVEMFAYPVAVFVEPTHEYCPLPGCEPWPPVGFKYPCTCPLSLDDAEWP